MSGLAAIPASRNLVNTDVDRYVNNYVEILSPSNSQRDIDEKFRVYQQAGVPEYWIIHPVEETVLVYRLGPDQTYVYQRPYSNMGQVTVGIFQDVVIDLPQIFSG